MYIWLCETPQKTSRTRPGDEKIESELALTERAALEPSWGAMLNSPGTEQFTCFFLTYPPRRAYTRGSTCTENSQSHELLRFASPVYLHEEEVRAAYIEKYYAYIFQRI